MNDYIYEFKDLPSTDIPYNAETFTAMQNKLLDSIYPIGRGFIDFTDTDFSNYLGFTWERELIGKVPVGIDSNDIDFNTIGKTGGEKLHTLTVDELAIHSHEFACRSGSGAWTIAAMSDGDGQFNATTEIAGGGQAHNNLQPYEVVAFWKRVA